MKKLSQLLRELPPKACVSAICTVEIPTKEYDSVIENVMQSASKIGADHAVILVESAFLPVDKRAQYLKILHPNANIISVTDVAEGVAYLKNKYSKIFMERGITNEDVVPHVELNDFEVFKESLSESARMMDAKRLFNDVRSAYGLEKIKEDIKYQPNDIREKYISGEIYNIGECVEFEGNVFEIVERGSNHLIVVDNTGETHMKWLDSVKPSSVSLIEDIQSGYAPDEVSFKGYKTKNLHHSEQAVKAFLDTISRFQNHDPKAILFALKATDSYMRINDLHLEQVKKPSKEEMQEWIRDHNKAREWLIRIGDFSHHFDYWKSHEEEMKIINTEYNLKTAGAEMSEQRIEETEKVDTKSKYNLAKSIMSYKDFLRMQGKEENMQPGYDDRANMANPTNVVGTSLAPDQNPTVRKMKVKYKVDEELDPQLKDKTDTSNLPRTKPDISRFVFKAKNKKNDK